MHSAYQSNPSESTPNLPAVGVGSSPLWAVRPPPGGSLGNTHEITQPPPDDKTALHRRLERFELQTVAASILKSVLRERRNGTTSAPRVCDCLHKPRAFQVEVWKSAKNGMHYYAGLVVCGSVWDCLPCAAKISEHRGNEIRQAVESWEAQGGHVAMLTMTFPHYADQHCKPLRNKFQDARRTMKNRKNYKRLMASIGLAGDINRTEVTYGQNGWHIHCHTLLFLHGSVKLHPGAFFPLWASACESVGLPSPSRAHGVSLSTPQQVAEYIAKQGKETSNWTIEKEMTKGHTKHGGKEGMTPFDLLRAFRDTKDQKYADLFIEYSKTFKGTKQLVWSRGLRELLNLAPEITDEEAAESVDEMDELLAMIPLKLWKYIRDNGFRGKLLEAANLGPEIFKQALDVLQTSAGFVEVPF